VILTQSRTTLLACLHELRNRIEQRHGSECVKAVQACKFAHTTSRAVEELLACAPSAPHAMMRLWDAMLRATAANKVALETQQGKDAAEKEVQDLKRELGGKKARAEASTIEINEGIPADVGDLDLADHRRHATRW